MEADLIAYFGCPLFGARARTARRIGLIGTRSSRELSSLVAQVTSIVGDGLAVSRQARRMRLAADDRLLRQPVAESIHRPLQSRGRRGSTPLSTLRPEWPQHGCRHAQRAAVAWPLGGVNEPDRPSCVRERQRPGQGATARRPGGPALHRQRCRRGHPAVHPKVQGHRAGSPHPDARPGRRRPVGRRGLGSTG
jgi:hypothetical protein